MEKNTLDLCQHMELINPSEDEKFQSSVFTVAL